MPLTDCESADLLEIRSHLDEAIGVAPTRDAREFNVLRSGLVSLRLLVDLMVATQVRPDGDCACRACQTLREATWPPQGDTVESAEFGSVLHQQQES